MVLTCAIFLSSLLFQKGVMSHLCSVLTPCWFSVGSQRAVNSREIALTSSLSTLYVIKASILYLFFLPSKLRSFSVIHDTNCANHLGTSGLFTKSCGEEGRCFSSLLDSSDSGVYVPENVFYVFLMYSWTCWLYFFLYLDFSCLVPIFSLHIYIPMPVNLFSIFWINHLFYYKSMKWSHFKKIACFLQKAAFPALLGLFELMPLPLFL